MKKKFKGELKHIYPELLVSKEKDNKIENFFITLGLVFNDLKGFLLFINLLEENYEKPDKDEPTIHTGNYGGVLVQTNRLIVSTIHEFFNFLEKNQDILSEGEFKEILNKLPKEDKNIWNGLFAAARGDLSNVTDFLKSILKIRHNIGFHYYQSGKILRDGYKSFFNRKERGVNRFAYYSIGDAVKTTRFFFSDAAAEEVMQLVAGKEEGGEENELSEKYKKQLEDTINVLFPVIVSIFNKYLQYKRNRPH